MSSAKLLSAAGAALVFALAVSGAAQAAAKIVIINQNKPGEGFNDRTPVAPVGGNAGRTLGKQRLIAFEHAARIWAASLSSPVPIRIGASFVPLACSSYSAVLGAAGAYEVVSDFPNAPRRNTWYPSALASKLAGEDQAASTEPHIIARFNSRLGLSNDCLPSSPFYLGLDNKAGNRINLVTVLLHEMAHGLGFQNFTDDETGERLHGIPSVWDWHLVDSRTGIPWIGMTDAQRAASATRWRGLSWNGRHVNNAVPKALAPRAKLNIGGAYAAFAAGDYYVGEATFGAPITTSPISGQLMPVVDQVNGRGLACARLNSVNTLAVRNNIALVDRGGCDFTVKARNVQAAGAIGMVLADTIPGELASLGGTDPAVNIPVARITLADGKAIKTVLQQRSQTMSGVIATLALDPRDLAGADAGRRILMYTPGVNMPGSTVSHFTSEAKRKLLMEPSISPDLGHGVALPRDLTFPLLRDIGW
jgi:hypothetical protein